MTNSAIEGDGPESPAPNSTAAHCDVAAACPDERDVVERALATVAAIEGPRVSTHYEECSFLGGHRHYPCLIRLLCHEIATLRFMLDARGFESYLASRAPSPASSSAVPQGGDAAANQGGER